jgi:hypothetical protein
MHPIACEVSEAGSAAWRHLSRLRDASGCDMSFGVSRNEGSVRVGGRWGKCLVTRALTAVGALSYAYSSEMQPGAAWMTRAVMITNTRQNGEVRPLRVRKYETRKPTKGRSPTRAKRGSLRLPFSLR